MKKAPQKLSNRVRLDIVSAIPCTINYTEQIEFLRKNHLKAEIPYFYLRESQSLTFIRKSNFFGGFAAARSKGTPSRTAFFSSMENHSSVMLTSPS